MKVSSVVEGDSVAGTYVEITSIVIQSLVDELEIHSLVANRGNCEILFKGSNPNNKWLPATLKYGESIEIPLRSNCDLIEADIDTSHGAATYTFQG